MPVVQPKIQDENFWLERMLEARLTNQPFRAVYHTDEKTWNKLQETHRKVLAKLIKPGQSLLDAGCGYGALTEVLPQGVVYLGIDKARCLVAWARVRYPLYEFMEGDLLTCLSGFPPGTFDVAICRSISGPITEWVGKDTWAEMQRQIKRVAYKLYLLSYTNPEEVIEA